MGATGVAAGGGAHAAAPAAAVHTGGTTTGGVRPSTGITNSFHAGQSRLANASGYRGSGLAVGGNRASVSQGFSASGSVMRNGTTLAGTSQNTLPVSRVNNAWTDPSDARAVGASGFSRYGGYATNYRRSDPVYSTRPGNHLYPGAYGYGQNGNNGSRNRRYYYNNFPYGVYYPYLYNNYGYGGYGNDGYGVGTADYSGLTTDNSVADLGTPDFASTPNNYYTYVAPEQDASNANPPASGQSLPEAPAVGPQNPSPSPDNSTGTNTPGPDSLVEAVQNELARRGYFAGKPDSMYSPATKEAIRRFQVDQGLPATGRINEATLHALRLD